MKNYLKFLSTTLLLFSCGTLATQLETVEVVATDSSDTIVVDGAVEAVRQSILAAQVQGRITALNVKAGDAIKHGEILVRIDERIAKQQAQAGRSQVAALQAQLDAASREYQRQQQLFKQGFISQAALDKAESEYKTVQAQTMAQMAQTESALVQTGLHQVTAPYDGVISWVNVALGDMASPGNPLITMYDPDALRVTLNVPQARASLIKPGPVTIQIPAAPIPVNSIISTEMTVLPSADATSQMVQVRFDLPTGVKGLVPGMFARARLTVESNQKLQKITIPQAAVFRRSEITAVYVLDEQAGPQLRLVRIGRTEGGDTEILAGLEPGEKVVINPSAVSLRH